jgi:hypothetical protein
MASGYISRFMPGEGYGFVIENGGVGGFEGVRWLLAGSTN